ncbi:hypothetical protein A9264_09535 [Vibrio sp. UCD-FRSSP16_10]|uniref:hypothetical protein n=1 Tax=unclassified Vibrio TaxID=2614977 RepID=UPI000800BB73|nr:MULTISPECIES: hypothetical protein [unclassified Vibrio]OBT16962.1 hypothetical protein A9260_09760 [Vibrio sp. UCD-FRSSP16_30]OBT21953.1 hypothetical protein A9264_09535 [Vibrio sp. UCD-FRSSP16_10]
MLKSTLEVRYNQAIYQQQKQGRLKLLALLFIFAIPVIAAHLILNQGWYQSGVTNKGVLIEPRFTFESAGLVNSITESWQLAFIVPERCDASCEQRWHLLNQSYIALGAYSDRVVITLLVSDTSDSVWLAKNRQQQPTLMFDKQSVPVKSQDYLLIDPLGQWVMRYPNTNIDDLVSQNKGLISDVRKILKLSRVG